ncbi:(2Fe-2S)-binding protein [Paraburkholderia sp. Tr-20389]|uniref:(2Fe-2S)-binding protein n=1 Tax=Paraburkholderia sp. Tr-20389 TaxID=2703903 RepID=UPI001981F730|nr:(2Fe-2S)-binding protein [Paraburkholderia sp. Tr-20389]MBN3751644.1 (2Fe-2S)-binding protein [Paraburkholderia sp. Tr-20389]
MKASGFGLNEAIAVAQSSGQSAAIAPAQTLPAVEMKPVSMTVNGRSIGPVTVPEQIMLIDFLHEYLGLTGSRLGCGQGVCHACVVILDNADGTSEEVRSCITSAQFFDGRKIRTIEGHATRDAHSGNATLSPIQQKFLEHFSFQCGYCTPGFVNSTTVLIERLKRHPIERSALEETISQALDAHLCRCTGYVRYYEAVKELVLDTPGLVKGSE